MDAFREIIEWAKTLPKWQQFIIKGILDGSKFDSAAIEEIVDIAIDDSKLKDDLLDNVVPNSEVSPKVSLIEISELNNINNLKDDETLSFNVTGLTVVYGCNGAGKSGYSRVVKKCCRSRDKKTEILGNIHTPNNKTQSAKIRYSVDGTEKFFVWDNDATAVPDLQLVHVFDRASGDTFLSKEADVQYRPAGMDILDKLIEILQIVESKLEERDSRLKITDLAPLFQNEYGQTKATALVEHLGASNAQEQYSALSKLNEAEEKDKKILSESIPNRINSSPEKEREKLRKKNDSLRSVKNYFSALLELISGEKIKSINLKTVALRIAKENAEKAKDLTFDSEIFLAGTGNEAWKIMWRAAERFSKESAYIGDEYPSPKEGAKCVLCQQTLDSDHAKTMSQFGAYVNNESQKDLLRRQSDVTTEINNIKGLIKEPADEDALLKGIEESYPDFFKELVIHLAPIRVSILEIVTALEKSTNIKMNNEKMEAYQKIESDIVLVIDENDAKLKEPLNDAEFKAKLDADQAELNGLKARVALKNHEVAILNSIRLLPERRKLEALRKQCGTFRISNKISELSKKYIIAALSECYDKELKNITNNKIGAELITSGAKQGVPYSKIVLRLRDGKSCTEKISDVLSEGELRGASLAGFFSELSMANNRSAIIFDDPVSSLDHINAGRIADRIAKEAESRQVIVFTHDILFVSYIMDRVEDKKIVTYKTVDSLVNAGLVSNGLPFDKLSVKARIGKLKDSINSEIRPAYSKNQIIEYKRLAEQFYKDLRMSWERAVEEILFGDVVKRYSRNVSTQQLRNVRYSLENARIVEDNMTLCSNKRIHDPASGEDVDLGTPEDLENNLKKLEDFRKANPQK